MKNVYTLLAIMLVMTVSAYAQPGVSAEGTNSWTDADAQFTIDVDDMGEDTEVVFVYGTTMGGPYTDFVEVIGTPDVLAGTGVTTLTADATGLTPGTMYYVMATASNGSGNTDSPEFSFTTDDYTPVDGAVTITNSNDYWSAQFSAMIDDNGADTEVSFSWGTTMGGPYPNTMALAASPDIAAGSGMTEVTYDLMGLTPGMTYYFVATATNSSGVLTTVEGMVAMDAAPTMTIISQPEDITDCEGTPGHLLTVVGGATVDGANFQWMRDGVDLIEGADFEMSTTEAGLVLGLLKYENAGVYTCDLWPENLDRDTYKITTDPLVLNVIQAPAITRQPENMMAEVGGTVSFRIEANILGKDETDYPVDIQWFLNEVAIVDGGRYSGANTNHLIVAGVTASDYTGEYKVAMGGMCGSVESNIVSVSAVPGVQIDDFTTTDGSCEGDMIVMTITASATNGGNDDDITYSWTEDGNPVGDNTNIYTYTLTNSEVMVEGTATNSSSGKSQTMGDTFVGLVNTAIVTEPASAVLTEGDDLVLFVEANGSNLTYQWSMMSGTMSATLTNNTSATYSVMGRDGGAQSEHAGVYMCAVTGDCGDPVVSASATITVTSSVVSSVDANENVFNLYNSPNPSYDGSTLINFNLGTAREARLNIVDAFGNTVLSTEVSGNSYSLSGLNSGSYFYILTAGENSVTRKMVIIK
jgi:Secretion system C-terminal sorting domain